MSKQKSTQAPSTGGSVTNAQLSFEDIIKTENDKITKRRNAQITKNAKTTGASGAPNIDKSHSQVGLALSGGGIRSATFSLGLLQSLSANKLIPRIDYLSTVSGGSYIGSFFGTLFLPPEPNGSQNKDDAETPSSKDWSKGSWTKEFLADPLGSEWGKRAVRNLRDFGRYLSPGGSTDLVLGFTVLVRNWLAVQMVLGLLALVVFLAVGLMLRALGLPPVSITLALGWLTASLALAYWFTRREDVPAPRLKRISLNGVFVFSLAFCACAMLIMLCDFAEKNDHILHIPAQIIRHIAPLLMPTLGLFLLFEFRFGKAISPNEEGGRAAEDKVRAKLSRATSDVAVLTLASLALLLINLLGHLLANAVQLISDEDALVNKWLTTPGSDQFWKMLWLAFVSYWPLLLPFIPLILTWWAFNTLRRLGRLDLLTGSLGTTVLGLTVMASWLIIWSGNSNGIIYPEKTAINWEFSAALLSWPGQTLAKILAISPQFPEFAGTPTMLWDAFCNWLFASLKLLLGSLKLSGVAALIFAAALAVIVNRAFTFLNLSSLSTLYASRLKRAYIGASTPSKKESAFDIDRPEDHVTLDEYYRENGGKGGPLHLINVTIAQTVTEHSNIAAHDRKGKAMHIGPAGIVYEGPTPGDKMVIDWRAKNQSESLPLATWVAISGAAASTAVGTTTSPGLSMLAMMANVRLGYWWKWGGDQAKKTDAGQAPLRTRAWRWFTDGVYGYLWDELNGKFRADSRRDRWYLTDGAHFENSGIYPLLQRKLSLIIASDNGADPDYQMSDMVRLINRARTDLGADIRFLDETEIPTKLAAITDPKLCPKHPWADIVGSFAALATRPGPNRGDGNKMCAALADITYADKKKGWLLLIKPKLRVDHDPGLHSYYRQSKGRFPQQTTGDQFFEEDQWEAYRRLGRSIGDSLFGGTFIALGGQPKAVWQTFFDDADKLR